MRDIFLLTSRARLSHAWNLSHYLAVWKRELFPNKVNLHSDQIYFGSNQMEMWKTFQDSLLAISLP